MLYMAYLFSNVQPTRSLGLQRNWCESFESNLLIKMDFTIIWHGNCSQVNPKKCTFIYDECSTFLWGM